MQLSEMNSTMCNTIPPIQHTQYTHNYMGLQKQFASVWHFMQTQGKSPKCFFFYKVPQSSELNAGDAVTIAVDSTTVSTRSLSKNQGSTSVSVVEVSTEQVQYEFVEGGASVTLTANDGSAMAASRQQELSDAYNKNKASQLEMVKASRDRGDDSATAASREANANERRSQQTSQDAVVEETVSAWL